MILIIKNISIEGPGIIGEFFKDEGYQLKTVDLEKGDALPAEFDEIQAVVVLGGPMNVYEEKKYPFLKKEDYFIKEALNREIPFLGICLGAQLLAKTLGARVSKAEEEEFGWYKIALTDAGRNDLFFDMLEEEFEVFQWHGDTFEVPKNASLLATSELCQNQAFRFGKNAYGLQFHVEVDMDMIKDWMLEYLNDTNSLLQQKGKQILLEYSKIENRLIKRARRICLNFEKIIKSSKSKI